MIDSKDFQKAIGLINASNDILITTHTRPDGDACGCCVAVQQALKPLGKNVKLLMLTAVPDWYRFLFAEPPAVLGEDVSQEQLTQNLFFSPDLIIIVDTNSINQLSGFQEYLKQNDKPVLIIDHHVTSDGLGDVELVDSAAAAAGMIIFDLLKHASLELTTTIAEALFVAVATDTGWFKFNNTGSRVHRLCAELIDAGANATQIYHDIYENFTPARIKLMSAMLNTLQLHLNDRYACQHLTQAAFQQTGATMSDTENLIDECRRINTVETAALFVELPDGKIKCSLRSSGTVDVRRIAQSLGGGGHTMASGVHLNGPLENAKGLIFGKIEEQMGNICSK